MIGYILILLTITNMILLVYLLKETINCSNKKTKVTQKEKCISKCLRCKN